MAYVLWALAVEEYGKGLILENLKVRRSNGEIVLVPKELFEGRHREKFNAGFGRIKRRTGDHLADVAIVFQNTSGSSILASHPRDPSWYVSVEGGITGEFEDVTSRGPGRRPASHRLRLELLYVGWDEKERVWNVPEPLVEFPGSVARFTVSADDLRRMIKALQEELKAGLAGE